MKTSNRRLLFKTAFWLLLCSFGFMESFAAAAQANSYQIVKVDQKDAIYQDLGKKKNDLGYQFLYIDKFYNPHTPLPVEEAGEDYVVEWRCSGVPKTGEKIVLRLEYVTENDSAIKTKDTEILVDRNGFFETTISHRGEEFAKNGNISSWKVSILRENAVVDAETSRMWAN
jgi:hypothetical protein